MGAQAIDVRAEEPAEEVLLHVLPRRLDHEVLRGEPRHPRDRIEDRQEVGIEIARLLDVARGDHRPLPVGRGDEVAAGNLAAEVAEVLGGQLQRRDQLDDRDALDRVGRERVIVRGEARGQAATGVDVGVQRRQVGHRQGLAVVGLDADEVPGLAVEVGERLRRIPVDRRQEALRRLRPARQEHLTGDPGQDRHQPRRRHPDPAPLLKPEEAQQHVDQERAEEEG